MKGPRNELSQEALRQLVNDTVLAPSFRRATFGGAVRGPGPSPWLRVVIRPIEIRGLPCLQFSYYDARKNIAKNHPPSEVGPTLQELLQAGYSGIHLSTASEEIDVRTSKKGRILLGRRPAAVDLAPLPSHNRVKNLPLPEGQADALLETLGIATHTGAVRPSMRAKFTQINEFLKLLAHVLEEAGLRSLGREVEILDCGCGLSYLTLAVHHYLKEKLGIPARILGVDVNEELIRKSIQRSEHLGTKDVRFLCRDISLVEAHPDIVLALHACDTATDDALAIAVNTQAKVLLSVPCCHHQLNEQLRATGPAETQRPLLRHGILLQRTADLLTDAFRALALRIMGYQAEIIEFVSPEHTARNLMIRAVRGLPSGEPVFVQEYLELRRFWSVVPYVEKALGEPFQQLLSNVHGIAQTN